jgi:hypothetical protein
MLKLSYSEQATGVQSRNLIKLSVRPTAVLLAATNPAPSVSIGTVLGRSTGIFLGQYQFTNSQGTNYPNLFYRIRWP